MQTRNVEHQPAYVYAQRVQERGRGLFQSKEVRDEVVKLLQTEGIVTARSVVSGQNLHPEYVTDYVGYLETGFGNSQYQTYWSKLYEVKVR